MLINSLKLLIILIISSSPNFALSQPKHIVDSLELELSKTKSSNHKQAILAQLTKIHLKPNPQKALQYLNSRLPYVHKDSILNKASIYNELGIAYHKMDSLELSINYHKKAFFIYEQQHKIKELGETNIWLAYNYIALNQDEKALNSAYRTLELYDSIGYKKSLSSVYTFLSMLNYKTKDLQKVLVNAKKAFAADEDKASSTFAANVVRAYMNLCGLDTSRNYSNSRAYLDSAVYYCYKALTIDEQNEDKNSIIISCRMLTELYLAQDKYQLALNSINKAFALQEYIVLPITKVEIQNSLAFVYYEMKEYQKSIDTYKKVLPKAIELGAYNHALITQQGIAKGYVKLGDFENAYKNLYKAFPIRDSILNKTKINQIKNIEIKYKTKYETDKKEQENNLLIKDLAIQKLTATRKRQQFNGLLGLFILGGIITYLLLRQYKIQSTQKMLQLKHRLLRNQMNPHFIFNALIAIQNFIYKNDPRKSGKYLSSFSKLVRAILENSRNEYIPLSKELQWLENYLDLQLLRFNDQFDFDIHVDSTLDLESVLIPPMLTQPFIENALEHGLKNIDYHGQLSVQFALKENSLMVTIQDNGIGILPLIDKSFQKEKHTSLATTITKERLDFLNKKRKQKIHLEITSVEPTGTSVMFSIPLKYIY